MYGTRILRFKFIFYVYLNYDFCSMLPFLIRVILRKKKKPMPIVNAWKRTLRGSFIALPIKVLACLFLYLIF